MRCVYCDVDSRAVPRGRACEKAPDGVHTFCDPPVSRPNSLFRRKAASLTQEQVEKLSEKISLSRREFVLVVFEQVQHFIESLRLTDLSVEVQRQQRDLCLDLADALGHPKRDTNRASTNYDVSERALKFLAQLSLDGQSKDVNIERDVLVAAMKVYISASNVYKLKRGEKHIGSGGVRVFVDHGYDDFLEDADDE